MADLLERQAASFAERGFITVPDALSAEQVQLMRDTIENHRRERPVSPQALPTASTPDWVCPCLTRLRRRGQEAWALWGESRDGGPSGEQGRWQSYSILHDTTVFDVCLDCPAVTPLIRRLLGPEGSLSSGTTRYREPVLEPPPPGDTRAEGGPWPEEQKIWWQLWHRCAL